MNDLILKQKATFLGGFIMGAFDAASYSMWEGPLAARFYLLSF